VRLFSRTLSGLLRKSLACLSTLEFELTELLSDYRAMHMGI
jgi:hypothetical protein